MLDNDKVGLNWRAERERENGEFGVETQQKKMGQTKAGSRQGKVKPVGKDIGGRGSSSLSLIGYHVSIVFGYLTDRLRDLLCLMMMINYLRLLSFAE